MKVEFGIGLLPAPEGPDHHEPNTVAIPLDLMVTIVNQLNILTVDRLLVDEGCCLLMKQVTLLNGNR